MARTHFPRLKRILVTKKRAIDIFDYDKVFVPINYDCIHQFYAVMYMEQKRIQIYNSSELGSNKYLKHLLIYLKDEHKERKDIPLLDPDKLSLIKNQPVTPTLENGSFYLLLLFIQIHFLL